MMVKQWNRQFGTVDHLRVEQWNLTSYGGPLQHLMVEQWKI